jgi:Ca-activated chloride channel homolog
MQERVHSGHRLLLTLIALGALPLLGFQSSQVSSGKSVFVLAVRDSHLFTMCPTTEAVSLPNGWTWKANGKAAVSFPFEQEEMIRFDDQHAWVTLPIPANGLGQGTPAVRSATGRNELDRVAPDPEIKRRIEKEFRKRKDFLLVDSLEKADLVFLAEGTYMPIMWGRTGDENRVGIFATGDNKAEFLQSVFAIVVPAASFSREAVQSAALMNSRLWKGSAILQFLRLTGGFEFAPASPEAVVAQFHNKQKRPPDHFPLCAASGTPLKIAGIPAQKYSEVPTLKRDPDRMPVLPPTNPKPEEDNQAIRANVVMVTVPVTISDQTGKRISDLAHSDFHLFEDDIEQKIDRVIPEAEPFDVALMLDTSRSMGLQAEEMQRSASAFAAALTAPDRIMNVSFNNRIEVQSDIRQLPAAVPSMQRVGGPRLYDAGTRLYDAIDIVLEDRLDGIKGRKAIVLFTDGVDTRSRIATAADTLAAIEESNVLVYAIQYDTSRENANQNRPISPISSWVVLPEDARNNSERYVRADRYLFSLCNGSGGELYVAPKGGNLTEVFTRIADQLSHQYTLAYYPSNPSQDGSLHRLRVEVNRPGAKVRSRIGYRVPGHLSVNR